MRGLYFQHDGNADSAFEAIQPVVERYGLQEIVRFTWSAYSHFHSVIENLRDSLARMTVLLILIIFSNIAVSYYLVANYFETNKFKLVVQRNFGYSALRRNRSFLFLLVGYSLLAILITTLFFGWVVLLIGGAVLIFDLAAVTAFERWLMGKSFAEIMKGER